MLWPRCLAALLVLAVQPVDVRASLPYDRTQEMRPRRRDDPSAREAARRRWYGGDFTPAFLRHLQESAAQERLRHGHLLPGGMKDIATPGNAWMNLGPTGSTNTPDSGRVVDIVPHPTDASILYIATSGGGVWKTTDGGSSWIPLSETLGTLSCGALAMDPANPQVLYLGLGNWLTREGSGGLGLVKSTDGGATWGPVLYLGDSATIEDIQVSPLNSSLVLVATDTGVFRSTDAGTTFTKVKTGLSWTLAHTGGSHWALSMEGSLAYSLDDGGSWSNASGLGTSNRMTVASAPSNKSIVYALAEVGSGCEVYKSTNGGQGWSSLGAASKRMTNAGNASTLAEVVGSQGWYDQMVSIDPSNPNFVVLGGSLGSAMTSNGGGSWANFTDWLGGNSLPYVHADFHSAAWGPGGVLYLGCDGGIFKSTNHGSSFTSLNRSITTHLFYNLSCSLANRNAVIGGLQDNGTRLRQGATGTFDDKIGGDGFGCLIHPTNANLMLGSVYYTDIQKSTDGGNTFNDSKSGLGSSGLFFTKIMPGPADASGNTVYTISDSTVYKSTNFGSTWTALGRSGLSGSLRNVAAAKSSGSVLGVVTENGVFLSSNGGSSWFQAGALPGSGGSLSYVWFDTANYNVVYAASVALNSTSSHLWKSSNFGSNWTAIDGGGFPSGIPVNVIQNDPGDSATLYAGTHLGVYKSTNGGTTWTRFGAGMPLVNVTDFYLAPDSSLMRAATFGRGIWELQTAAGAPSITQQPAPATVNEGQPATFNVTASGTSPLAYQWRKNGTVISGATSASYTTPPATAGDNGAAFSVAVSNGVGSVTSGNAILTVLNAATAPSITSQPTNATVNAGASATFSVVASGTAPLSYQWRKNSVAISGATSANYTTPATTTADSGSTFSVVVSNAAGSTTSNNATLTVTPVIGGTFNESEPNNTLATANLVAPTYTAIQGYLTATTDVDCFAITLQPGQAITLKMTGPTGPDWDLYLKNAAGTTLTSSIGSTTSENLSYTNSGSTPVTVYPQVIVYSGTSASPYTLALTYSTPVPSVTFNEVEPNDSMASANIVSNNVTKIVGYIGAAGDNDNFALSVAPGRTLKVNMTGPVGSTYDYDLYVYDASGTLLTSSTGATTTESCSWTNSGSTPATVYVSVQQYAGSSTTTSYKLAITR
jgi:hypothetical protein